MQGYSLGDVVGHTKDIRKFGEAIELIDSNTYIGVEVELEGVATKGIKEDCELLRHTHDYSLRGALCGELLFDCPLKGGDVVTALTALETYVLKYETVPIRSSRTSTHVHIDVRDLSIDQLRNFIIVYLSTERLLSTYCGKAREENIFCVPIYKSSKLVKSLSLLFEESEIGLNRMTNLLGAFSDSIRYGALNFNSLWKHGTLEFRMLRGEYEANKIIEWINILLSIKKYAINATTEEIQAPNHLFSTNCEVYVDAIFGEYANTLKYDGYEHDIVKGARVAHDVMHSRSIFTNYSAIAELACDRGVRVTAEIKAVQKAVFDFESINTEEPQWETMPTFKPFPIKEV